MSGHYWKLNIRGEPVPVDDVLEWGRWYESADRQVAEDFVADVRVSTVFLALDHQYGDGPPLLFETMIFKGELDGYQDRYATREEALAGHARAVAEARRRHPERN